MEFNTAGELFIAGADYQVPNAHTALLLKLDPAGNTMWWTNYGQLNQQNVLLDVDANGTIFMTYSDGPVSLSQITTLQYGFNTAITESLQSGVPFLFPNPATETVSVNDPAQRTFVFTLYNTQGQLIRNEPRVLSAQPVSLAGVAAGIYFYNVQFEDGTLFSGKLVKE
jgi:hypothetical protein